jgi:hypothetical protein
MGHPREEEFRSWSKPPSDTEQQRCENAEKVVCNAIRASALLATRKVEVFVQGSYRTGTNIRANSDVDVCVRCMDPVFTDLPGGASFADVGLVGSTYTFAEFKNEVGIALKEYLGPQAVSRGKKAFDLHENTYRVDADVVATFEHRRYRLADGQYRYDSGTQFYPDGGGRPIVNWPHQNYENGLRKNADTNTRFKKLVRVLKRLRNEMANAGISEAESIPSYLIECLVFNAPDDSFAHEEYATNLKSVLLNVWLQTSHDEAAATLREVNRCKYLFHPTQPWTREAVHDFILAALSWAAFLE